MLFKLQFHTSSLLLIATFCVLSRHCRCDVSHDNQYTGYYFHQYMSEYQEHYKDCNLSVNLLSPMDACVKRQTLFEAELKKVRNHNAGSSSWKLGK